MFGFGAPEFIILFIVVATIFYISKLKGTSINSGSSSRKCLSCGFEGQMKTWLRNYSLPQFILIVLLLCWAIPGLIFMAWAWGKHKCPRCGALGKNMMLSDSTPQQQTFVSEKKCPFCAEIIKQEAIVCKHCGRDMPQLSPS